MMKSFHLSDILSISTGRLVSTRHITGVYDILGYMSGEQLQTVALGRVADEALPYLFEQMPWLRDIQHDHVNEDNWQDWLAELIEAHGEYHDVRPMHPEDHERIDPLEEVRSMIGPNVRLISHNMGTGQTTVHDDD